MFVLWLWFAWCFATSQLNWKFLKHQYGKGVVFDSPFFLWIPLVYHWTRCCLLLWIGSLTMTGHCTSLTSFSLAPGGSGFLNMPTSCCAPVHSLHSNSKEHVIETTVSKKTSNKTHQKKQKVFEKVCWAGFIFKKKAQDIQYIHHTSTTFFKHRAMKPPNPITLARQYPLSPISSRLLKTQTLGSGRGEGKHHNMQVT